MENITSHDEHQNVLQNEPDEDQYHQYRNGSE